MESLTRLREQRAFLCRLSPDRALGSVEEADTFLRDRGLLTRTADCALPSLYEACHEDPYQPGRPGFATWPATKWPWFGELADRGHLITAVHRGKSLLISGAVARLLDPICRAEITRMGTADRGWGRLLDHLAAAGPSSIEDLRTELGLKRQELKALRAPLERCGAIVSRSLHVTAGQGHQHSSELARWDQAYRGSGGGTSEDPAAALRDLIAAAVRAAVLAPETELRRWFSWQWYWADSLVDDLIGQGRLRRIDGHVTVAPRKPRPGHPGILLEVSNSDFPGRSRTAVRRGRRLLADLRAGHSDLGFLHSCASRVPEIVDLGDSPQDPFGRESPDARSGTFREHRTRQDPPPLSARGDRWDSRSECGLDDLAVMSWTVGSVSNAVSNVRRIR